MPMCIETEFPLGYVSNRLSTYIVGESEPRAVGWHISSIIKASRELAKGKPLDPNYYYCSEDSPDMDGLAETIPPGILDWGNIWEAACRPALSEWCQQRFGLITTGPMQTEKDGIVANADALVLSHDGESVIAIGECKFKFSGKTDPLDNDDWICQIKGYCHMWSTNMVLMPIGNVRSGPPGGASRMYILTLDPSEIAENWQMLVNVKNYLEDMRNGIIG